MEDTFESRKEKADRYLAEQLAIIAALFPGAGEARVSTTSDDYAGVDCYVGTVCVSLRVRSANCVHYDDIAIRRCELPKILHTGAIRYMLYCFKDKDNEARISSWKLIDLDALRRAKDSTWLQSLPVLHADNGDEFYAVPLARLEETGPAVAATGNRVSKRIETVAEDGLWVETASYRGTVIRRRKRRAVTSPCGV